MSNLYYYKATVGSHPVGNRDFAILFSAEKTRMMENAKIVHASCHFVNGSCMGLVRYED